MARFFHIAARPVAVALAFTFVAGIAHGEDQDVIDYRQRIMKTLNEQAEIIGMILSKVIPTDNTAAHIETMAITAGTALKAFEPKVPGGEAKPEVWSKWPDFSKRMTEFATKTANAAKAAKQSGPQAGLLIMTDTDLCKGCHDTYRQEETKKR